MDRNHSIIMYVTTDIEHSLKVVRCFACIGRKDYNNLCSNIYLKDINPDYTFWCGVNGYNKNAIRKSSIEHFNNNVHKIIMTTSQCFLCSKQCKYPEILCEKILKTITKYKEVVGII